LKAVHAATHPAAKLLHDPDVEPQSETRAQERATIQDRDTEAHHEA
jgi:hypothetical protein